MADRPPGSVRDGVVINGVGCHPLRGALVDVDMLSRVGDGGHQLESARTGPDDRYPLTRQVDVVAPIRGMERRSAEVLGALNIRDDRVAELADRADQGT